MKLFTQLALVTAIATSGSAFAMQTMNDSDLSATTGQDGITILIAPPKLTGAQQTSLGVTQTNGILIGAAVLHDKDGIVDATNTTGTSGGAIIIGDAKQANAANTAGTQLGIFGSTPISVVLDASGGGAAGSVSGTSPVLNVKLGLPSDLLIRTGDISVDGSNRGAIAVGAAGATAANAAVGGTTGNAVKVLNSMDIALGGATMNIQLGHTPQGAFINAAGTITGGLSIANLSVHDATYDGVSLGGDLGVSRLTVTDTGSANLTLNAGITVTKDVGTLWGGAASAGGLVITTAGNASDIMLQNVTLGSANSTLGDLQLINVQSAGTHIAIQGH
ncbi:DUF6160 family protein [Aquirhabdus sp.]|uniref:putative pilus system protein FilA n=1 Tax=Aquirhabdus sp. TaxID=2824160 RepID=UPI00396C792C